MIMPEHSSICPCCGLNPNDSQSDLQQKWEAEFVEEHGHCSACEQEMNI